MTRVYVFLSSRLTCMIYGTLPRVNWFSLFWMVMNRKSYGLINLASLHYEPTSCRKWFSRNLSWDTLHAALPRMISTARPRGSIATTIGTTKGHGTAAECTLWSALWASALTQQGRGSFHLTVDHQTTEIDFQVKTTIGKPTPIPPEHFLPWWAVRTFRSTMDCLRVPAGIYISLKWCKRVLWEGHVREDLLAGQLIDVIQSCHP